MNSTHILMADASLDAKQARNMIDEMNDVDGVQYAVGFNSLVGSAIPEEVIPDSVKEVLKGDEYQLILIGSEYEVATDEVNDQVAELNDIAAKYDDKAMLIGEAPATKVTHNHNRPRLPGRKHTFDSGGIPYHTCFVQVDIALR